MKKSSFEIVCEIIRVCEYFGISYTLESNKVGDYRLIIGFSPSIDLMSRFMSGSFAYAVLKVVNGYLNTSSCFNADSASLNICVWSSSSDDCKK